VYESRSSAQRSSTLSPGRSERSSSTPRHISRHVGSSWLRRASERRVSAAWRAAVSASVRAYRSMAGISVAASNVGSVAGPAGGQISGSSASRAASNGSSSNQASSAARLASSIAL
jgi:hypothetical protein